MREFSGKKAGTQRAYPDLTPQCGHILVGWDENVFQQGRGLILIGRFQGGVLYF